MARSVTFLHIVLGGPEHGPPRCRGGVLAAALREARQGAFLARRWSAAMIPAVSTIP
jgi:hypothetical protein